MISGDPEIRGLLTQIPEGWAPQHEGYSVVVTKPVSQFTADPDARRAGGEYLGARSSRTSSSLYPGL
jgi:hypothetical protein